MSYLGITLVQIISIVHCISQHQRPQRHRNDTEKVHLHLRIEKRRHGAHTHDASRKAQRTGLIPGPHIHVQPPHAARESRPQYHDGQLERREGRRGGEHLGQEEETHHVACEVHEAQVREHVGDGGPVAVLFEDAPDGDCCIVDEAVEGECMALPGLLLHVGCVGEDRAIDAHEGVDYTHVGSAVIGDIVSMIRAAGKTWDVVSEVLVRDIVSRMKRSWMASRYPGDALFSKPYDASYRTASTSPMLSILRSIEYIPMRVSLPLPKKLRSSLGARANVVARKVDVALNDAGRSVRERRWNRDMMCLCKSFNGCLLAMNSSKVYVHRTSTCSGARRLSARGYQCISDFLRLDDIIPNRCHCQFLLAKARCFANAIRWTRVDGEKWAFTSTGWPIS